MRERSLYQMFHQRIVKADPNCYFYKIPDTHKLGGKKPFDSFLILRGIPFAIEFKMKGGKVTAYQDVHLDMFVVAGGQSRVFTYGENDFDEFIESLMQTVNMCNLKQQPLFKTIQKGGTQ